MSAKSGVVMSQELQAKDGSFQRKDAVFRSFIEEGGKHPPAAGRYHLYISYACPWANRCLAALYLKGLEDAIGVSITHHLWARTRPDQDEHCGWRFAEPDEEPVKSVSGYGSFTAEGAIPDSVNNAKFVRDLYEKADPSYKGVYSVPVLWDKELNTVVSNESSEIIRMFNSAFNSFAKKPELDLYPESLRSAIDSVNEWTYPCINNGVYRCGFAKSQAAYETAFNELFDALDRVEEILSKQKYVAGDVFTEADLRLFMTLIRFDDVYVVYFKTNKKFLHQYDQIREYVKEIYQMPEIKKSINMKHIKEHYFGSHPTLNTYSIVPVGPGPWYDEPHNRGK